MNFEKFDINKVMSNGTHLLGSEGSEYELKDNNAGNCAKSQLKEQRLKLNKRLGLDLAEKMGFDTNDIFSNEDLLVKNEQVNGEEIKINLSEVFDNEINVAGSSNRETMKNRRRSRLYSKQRSKEAPFPNTSPTASDPPLLKKTKNVLVEQSLTDVAIWDSVLDNEGLWEDVSENRF